MVYMLAAWPDNSNPIGPVSFSRWKTIWRRHHDHLLTATNVSDVHAELDNDFDFGTMGKT